MLVTQRIALIRDLHTQQTLTAIHDKSSAWLGIGSSMLALFDQVSVPSATSKVVFITLYLAGITVLHVSIPISWSIGTYNAAVSTLPRTDLARPNHAIL